MNEGLTTDQLELQNFGLSGRDLAVGARMSSDRVQGGFMAESLMLSDIPGDVWLLSPRGRVCS